MKRLGWILILGLILSSCNTTQTSADEVIYECLGTNKSEDLYYEEYFRVTVDETDLDTVYFYDGLYNYFYDYIASDQENAEFEATNRSIFEGLEGVTYSANFQPYASQERIMYDYRVTNFEELADRGLLVSDADQVPDYVSYNLMKQDLLANAKCQEFVDNEEALYHQLLGPLSLDLDASEFNTDLFDEDRSELSNETITLECVRTQEDVESKHTFVYNPLTYVVNAQESFDAYNVSYGYDLEEVEAQGIEQSMSYNQLAGVAFEYELDRVNMVYSVMLQLDYLTTDFQALVDSGLMNLTEDNEVPTYVDVRLVFEDYQAPWSCVEITD